MALLKFFCLTAATIIVTVETFADFAIVLSHIAGIGSLVSVEGQSNGDVEWGYAGRRKGLSDHTLHVSVQSPMSLDRILRPFIAYVGCRSIDESCPVLSHLIT